MGMRISIFLIIAISIFFCSCQTPDENFNIDAQEQISDSLKTLAIDFLRSWEPPFNPDKALRLFTKSEDFHLVIDGFPIKTFKEFSFIHSGII